MDYKCDIRMTNECGDQLLELVDKRFDLTVIEDGKVDILRKRMVNQ